MRTGIPLELAKTHDSGDLFNTLNICKAMEAAGEATLESRYLEVLTLARIGDHSRARQAYEEYGLDQYATSDAAALGARLLKDQAFAECDPGRRRLLLGEAASAYYRVYERFGGSFPLVNAATLAELSGGRSQAVLWAEKILEDCSAPLDYWSGATVAEALLILGRLADSHGALVAAMSMPGATPGACTSTYRQLKRLCTHLGANADEFLAPIKQPRTLVFVGHIFLENEVSEERLAAQINHILNQEGTKVGYGGLAAGADILIAECLLAADAELHVILPFAKDDFITQSVTSAGTGWLPRFRRCLEAATTVTFASEMHFVGDDQQYAYGARVAMGKARLRAEQLCTTAVQLAVWDGQPSATVAGTGAEVKTWQASGGLTLIVRAGSVQRPVASIQRHRGTTDRANHAILFTDYSGFSKLSETALPIFWKQVMGRAAEVLEGFEEQLRARNTWGDAIFLVIEDAGTAADIALCLQKQIAQTNETLSRDGLRLALHYGPMYRAVDPITRNINFFGTEVSRAARVEPITPPGFVYVTEPFAAALQMEARGRFRTPYIGLVSLPKNYGAFPIYRLEGA